MAELNRVMHVDDDESIRMITSVTLESIGNFKVLSCDSGFMAIENYAEFQPQVVLMDVMMPDLDGPGTLAELKKQFDLAKTLVLFMTAKVQKEELEHFKDIGGFDVIEKPFDPMTLTDKIKSSWESFNNS